MNQFCKHSFFKFSLVGLGLCALTSCETSSHIQPSEPIVFVKEKNVPWEQIPEPVYSPEPGYVDLYRQCWEIAYHNMKVRDGMPQSPFIDEGFGENDNQNWIWDTCFMVMFSKYAPNVFPGTQTLNNFYKPLHDGVKIPEMIHLADNPPLFAWAEYQNALFTGDKAHLSQLLQQDSYLQRHFNWLESLEKREKLPGVQNITHWRKHPVGYFWEGGCSGMDNTVRGRPAGNKKFKPHRPNNPDMLWVDAISQQALSCYYIAELSELINDKETAQKYRQKHQAFADILNAYYYDSTDGVYYDIHCKTYEKIKVLTPASYWPVLSGIPSQTQMKRMVEFLNDSQKLGTPIPWTTLSADHVDFDAETGDYWRGAMWLPTAYMGIKGLEKYGYMDLAHEQSKTILNQQFRTFHDYEPHTIWECYSPTKNLPSTEFGRRCRPNFCGWSALGPISLFIENVIGIYSVDAFKNEIKWHLKETQGEVGIKRLKFGNTLTDLIAKEGKEIHITSNHPYTLIVNGKIYSIQKGFQIINIQ